MIKQCLSPIQAALTVGYKSLRENLNLKAPLLRKKQNIINQIKRHLHHLLNSERKARTAIFRGESSSSLSNSNYKIRGSPLQVRHTMTTRNSYRTASMLVMSISNLLNTFINPQPCLTIAPPPIFHPHIPSHMPLIISNNTSRISSNHFRIPHDACLTSRFIPAASKVALLRSRSGLISDRPRSKRVKWYRCSSSRITPWNIQTNLKQSSRLNQKSIKKVRQKDQITTTSRCRRMIL